MIVFYRGPCAYITHEVFESHCPYYRLFVIRELKDVYVVHRPRHPGPSDRFPVRAGSAGVAGAAAVAAAVGWPILEASSLSLVATAALAVTLVISATAIAACLRVRPGRLHQLWAIYQGQPTCLFETADARTFGQVRRALIRAIERIDDG